MSAEDSSVIADSRPEPIAMVDMDGTLADFDGGMKAWLTKIGSPDGKVLVDDWPAYIAPWLKRRPRGLVIMPAQPWNVGFGHNNIIRVTNDADNSLSRAWEALAAIRKTCLP